jgi:ubiquinone biosynthesis protein Coq4
MATIHADLRAAWEAKVRDFAWGGPGIEPLREVFARTADPAIRTALDPERLGEMLWTSVVLARLAWIAPDETIPVYDEMAARWLGGSFMRFDGPPVGDDTLARLGTPAALPPGLPALVWQLAADGIDSPTVTQRIAAFGAVYPGAHREACAHAMEAHAGWQELTRKSAMPRTKLDDVAGCAPGTLGHAFHRLIVENGFDIEVLDPDSVVGYHPVIDPTNRRILQTHEIWHLIAGYSTSALHEVAISGFQLAQFGHGYSRDFLATAFTITTLTMPVLAPVFLQVTLEGWRHGRQTPPLMLVDWDALWHEPMDAIRERHGVRPFISALPDIQMPAGA